MVPLCSENMSTHTHLHTLTTLWGHVWEGSSSCQIPKGTIQRG